MFNTLDKTYYDELMFNFSKPSRISHADGYVALDENEEATFYYYLTDHLGNDRSVITPDANNNPVVTQANEYFPFGMSIESKLPTLTKSGSGYNKHKYNGLEEQEVPGGRLGLWGSHVRPNTGKVACGGSDGLTRLARICLRCAALSQSKGALPKCDPCPYNFHLKLLSFIFVFLIAQQISLPGAGLHD